MCGDHSIAIAADDSTLQSSASGADTGSGNALFFEPGVGKKCFASCSCCAVDCYAKKKNYTRSSYDLRERSANTNLEGDEADENACDEENKGDEEPDDTPHFCRILASRNNVRGGGRVTLRREAPADLRERRCVGLVHFARDGVVYKEHNLAVG